MKNVIKRCSKTISVSQLMEIVVIFSCNSSCKYQNTIFFILSKKYQNTGFCFS